MEPAPKARLAAFVLAVTGAMIVPSPAALACFWAVALVPLCFASGVWRAHFRFLGVIIVPIAAMLAVVWVLLVGAPPGRPPGSDQGAAASFAALTALRLVVLGGCAQLLLLAIPRRQLLDTFRQWGLRGELLLAALATFVFFPELRIRADQIVTARMARGLVANRRLWTRVRQLAPSMGVLFTLSVRSATRRAAHWEEQDLLTHFSDIKQQSSTTSTSVSSAVVVIALLWLALCIWLRAAS